MKNKTIIILAISAFLISLPLVISKVTKNLEIKKAEIKNEKTFEEILKSKKQNYTKTQKRPESYYLEVPFICQAPLETEKNWTLHEESCEEAAVLQAYLYEKGQSLTKQEANEEILKMIDWEIENLGSHKDLYAKELKSFILSYYSLEKSEVQIISDASISDIKDQIWQGHPVIVPITGNILKNPFYPYPGYHMLVAIGYTENQIVTNDNGTRRGANFSYDQELFEKAFKDAGSDILIFNFKD